MNDSPMIKFQGVTKLFKRNRVLDGIDLDIALGERIALIGSTGTGRPLFLRVCFCISLSWISPIVSGEGNTGFPSDSIKRSRSGSMNSFSRVIISQAAANSANLESSERLPETSSFVIIPAGESGFESKTATL